PEARDDSKTDPSYGRVKDPVLLLTGLARALGVTTDGAYFASAAGALEQSVYQAPSVFSFYPPDYPLAGGGGLVSPASALLDSASVFPRANVVWKLLYAPPGPDPTVTGATGTQTSLGDLAALGSGDADTLVRSADALFLHRTMPDAMRSAITGAVNARDPSDVSGRIRAVAYLVLTSPAYQVER